MATITTQTLIGLAVETQHGTPLGHVVFVEIDVEQHVVRHYAVSQGGVLRRLQQLQQKESELLIAPEQVVSISAEKMVVVDLTTGEPVDASEQWEAAPAPASEPVEPSVQ